ncbi:HTTM domain-containing protein [Streptomyces sp. JJ36]|uniref:HTTM domain-containing protein n=1 Tax=Streptomyces sp. JJ36 TaxID=2736645 RepID=UPI001F3D8612|nr:HTTM domain-containing protein [Streptomyces sp. JJ36]
MLGPYQSAVVRIGFSLTWLLFLLREWPHRHELYGPGSPWGLDLAERLVASNQAFTVLLWSDSETWFESVYALAVLSSAALLLGWRTRTASVLFMAGVLSLQNRSVFMGDGGDNVVHLMALYLVLTRCGRVWSLDARRAARNVARSAARTDVTGIVLWVLAGLTLAVVTLGPGLSGGWALVFWGLWAAQAVWWAVHQQPPGEARTVCDILANLVHNGALLVIMAEVCLIYATAGWYKIQGSRWQDGTAVYYPLHLDYFAPWPGLNEVVASSGMLILLMTYGTVIVQVAFPFTLFNRRVKNVLLAMMIAEHLSIAVLMGLPFFSLAMIAADAVFLPTALLVWVGARSARLRDRFLPGGVVRDTKGPYGTDGTPGTGAGEIAGPGAGAPDAPGGEPEPAAAERPADSAPGRDAPADAGLR